MKNIYVILLIICLVLTSCNNCEFNNRRNLEDYSGIVFEKNYYEWDHGTKILFIKKGDEIKKYFFSTDYYYDEFWRQIKVGDSISKVKNELELSIYREKILVASKEVRFECK